MGRGEGGKGGGEHFIGAGIPRTRLVMYSIIVGLLNYARLHLDSEVSRVAVVCTLPSTFRLSSPSLSGVIDRSMFITCPTSLKANSALES